MDSRLEVVRQDYFNSIEEIQFSFSQGRAYINGYGLRQYPDDDYIQILIDREKKTMIIKPCPEKVKDSFKWCTRGRKRIPRKMRCATLYYLIYQMMGWSLKDRYRITGFRQKKPEDVLQFDLTDAIQFVMEENKEEKGHYTRKKVFPKEWEMHFGEPVDEHNNGAELIFHDNDEAFEIKLPVNISNTSRKRTEDKTDGTEKE